MKIVIQDMENNILKEIKDMGKYELFSNSPRFMSVEYDENFKIFDKLNQDLIILKFCKNSKDFVVEFISQNYIDLINSIYANDHDFTLSYKNIVGRYFSKLFPFIKENNLLRLFIKVAETGQPFEFREVKYIDDILISIYRHKLFLFGDKLFHLSYLEEDLDLLYFAGEEFFNKSERPYILIEGNEVLKVNSKFLDYFDIEENDILGFYDFGNLDLVGIGHDDLDMILNNLLNRKSLFETFEFSFRDSKDRIRWLRAFASPSSHNYNPAVKMFFNEITEEKDHEMEAYLLRDTLDLVQTENDIAGFYMKHSKSKTHHIENYEEHLEGGFLEENILSSNVKNLEKERFLNNDIGDDLSKVRDNDKDILNKLNQFTVYSKGIFNILDLNPDDLSHSMDSNDLDEDLEISDSLNDDLSVFTVYASDGLSDDSSGSGFEGQSSDDFGVGSIGSGFEGQSSDDSDNLRRIDFKKYISDLDIEDFKSELSNFSKNYDTINTNIRIISERNREKYINFIIEGEFNENGENLDYIGFLKDNTDRILNENMLKGNLTQLDVLLSKITEVNRKLEKTQKSEEKLLNDSHVFIKDLLYLFIRIMDYSLKSGLDKKIILENFKRRINVLLLIHQYIDRDFDLLNISVKDYIEECLNYLSNDKSLNLSYKTDLDDVHINIGSLAFLGIIIYEFAYNIFAGDEISISLRKKRKNAYLTFTKENSSGNKGSFNIKLVEEILNSLDFQFSKSKDEDSYELSIPIVNEHIVSLNN